ncbi:hypothetical protein [Plantibacter sp. YIM 135249]|uniref:hypothetical protein n=1 Tax=Plantibacter sp. YIM 135249 TaxID=3423918 RepID=UPI003D33A852
MSLYSAPDIGPFDHVNRAKDASDAAQKELQRPAGGQWASLFLQVQTALANITSTVTAAIASLSYTKSEIDGRIASPGAISPSTVSASGSVSGSTGTFNGGVFSTDARNFVVVTNYAASWIDVNGHFGISPSSRRFKQDIETWSPDLALLFSKLRAVRFRYNISDQPIGLDAHGNPILGPHPDPGLGPLQYGFIAEELVEAGLEQFTFKDADGLVMGINYDRLVVPLFAAIQAQQSTLDDLLQRVEALEGGSGGS